MCMVTTMLCVFRRHELRELRLMQKEANRAQAVLNAKLETQREQMHRRFEQEMNVSNRVITQNNRRATNASKNKGVLFFLNSSEN